MTTTNRLDKVFATLSAQERATLVLRAYKEGRKEEPGIRESMPAAQSQEFNRHVAMIETMNTYLPQLMLALSGAVEQLPPLIGWLATLGVRAADGALLADFVSLYTNPAITKSQYKKLVEDAREQFLPVETLASLVVGQRYTWAVDDVYAEAADDGAAQTYVRPEARRRALRETIERLEGLVEEGVLSGRREGRRLLVQAGTFYDWLGEPLPIRPEWGLAYDTFPDDQTDRVARRNKDRERVRECLASAPASPVEGVPFLDPRQGSDQFADTTAVDRMAEGLADKTRETLLDAWKMLRCIERVLTEVAKEFDGEDPTPSEERESLDSIRALLLEYHEQIQSETGKFELSEPP